MNNRKRNILIYLDSYPMVAALTPEQRGWVFTALMVYGDRLSWEAEVELDEIMEQFPQLTPEARMVCAFMAGNILRDTQRWLSRQKSRAGSAAPRRTMAPGPAPDPTPAQEQKMREDMERTRLLMERLREEP